MLSHLLQNKPENVLASNHLSDKHVVGFFVCLFGCKYLKLKNPFQLQARPGDPETKWFRISCSLGSILGFKCPLLKHLSPWMRRIKDATVIPHSQGGAESLLG